MTKGEAIILLSESRELAVYLLNHPQDSSLYPGEGDILLGVHQVIEAGYAQDNYVREMTSLSREEFSALERRLDYHYARGSEQPNYQQHFGFSYN